MPAIIMRMNNAGITLMKTAGLFIDQKINHFGNGLMMDVMILMKLAGCIVTA